MKRFWLLMCVFLLLLGCASGNGDDPYIEPVTLTGIEIDWSTLVKAFEGSDNFAITLAYNGVQYAVWGDGWGDNLNAKCSLGVSTIWGDFDNQVYDDLWWGEVSGKSYGILGANSVLYMWIGWPGSMEQTWEHTSIALSTDNGNNWAVSDWHYLKAHGFHTPCFLQAGLDYQDAPDDYIYSYATGNNDPNGPNYIYCFRVHKEHILEWTYYQYWTVNGWSNDIKQMQPIHSSNAGLDTLSVTYFKDLVATQHTEIFKGNLLLLQSVTPYGPFTEFHREYSFGGDTFFWNFSLKWSSGKDFVMIYTGINSEDAYHSVKGSFITQ
jgi:hypothetical protein